jgi:uncharacterized protein YcfL
MKKAFILIISIWSLAGCSSSKKTTVNKPAEKTTSSTTTTTTSTISSNVERDGSSFAKAIIIDEKSESKGVDAEYAWIKKHYSGYTINGQALKQYNNKPHDIISITTDDGKKVDLYFDISSFYGK